MPNQPIELENWLPLKPTEDLRNLQILEEITRESRTSQRQLARNLGVALGVANACLKKMVKKGFVKACGINHCRIAYYVTPEGLNEKTRLAYHFIQHTIKYYSNLRKLVSVRLNLIAEGGAKTVVFYGAGEVMEVALISLQATDIQLLGIVDDDPLKQGRSIFGYTIEHPDSISRKQPQAVLVTSIKYKSDILLKLKRKNGGNTTVFHTI